MNEAKFDNNDFQTKAPDLLADLAKYTVMAVRECYPEMDANCGKYRHDCGVENRL